MIKTPKHLAYTLKVELTEIETILNNIGKHYREKVEPKIDKSTGLPKLDSKGQPKVRVINPSQNRLKVIQKRIDQQILAKLPMPTYAYGAVKNADNITNAERHKGKKYKFTTDLKDFFPSITNKAVYGMFLNEGFSPDVSSILSKLTTYKGKIPQGAPTSSRLANLVFKSTGAKMEQLAIENNLTFTSFVDDMTFSSADDFHQLVPSILKIITEDYKISHPKTNYSRNPTVTGLIIRNNHLEIPKSFITKLQNKEKYTENQIAGMLRYKNRVVERNRKNKQKKNGNKENLE